ncbi:hypothetical protein KY342_00790, partial [Candidatus Woesearchaeota archaeon]|nr:hypothetical protein [Candidatus Woesearchaeota archaeon]
EELSSLRKDYDEQSTELTSVKKENAEVKSGMEYYWANAHMQFQEAIKGLRAFYGKAGVKIDEETLAKSVGYVLEKQRTAVKEADVRVTEIRKEVEEIRRNSILARALMELDSEKPILVINRNNVIEGVSKSAERLIGRDVTKKYIDSVYSGLAFMIDRVAETYEPGFDIYSVKGLNTDRIVKVHIGRVVNEYIGAVLTFEEKGWFGGLFREKDKIREAVNKTVILNDFSTRSIINLTKLKQVPEEIGRRLYGLSRSDYFRHSILVRVANPEVYETLEKKYGIPFNMLEFAGELKVSTEEGLEGALPKKV